MTKKVNYTYATGRRREAIARVRLFHGKGENTVNGKKATEYFITGVEQKNLLKPFSVTGTSDKYYFSAKVTGGGKNGQLEAIVLGLSKTLATLSQDKNKPLLRKAELLTRDSRSRLRRMVGTGGKARRQKQSPKR